MADRRQAKRPCILSEAELEERRVEYVRRRAAGIAYLRNPSAPGALEEGIKLAWNTRHVTGIINNNQFEG